MEALRKAATDAPKDVEAQLAYGKALFEDSKYIEARKVLTAASKIDGIPAASEKSCKLWIRKCNTHVPDTVEEEEAPPAPAKEAPAPAKEAPKAAPVAASHNVRFEWFQTAAGITLTFFVKGRTQDDVKTDISSRSFEIDIKLGEGHEYNYSIDRFFSEIDEKNVKVDVRPMKIEISLPKAAQGIQWPLLEAPADADPVAVHSNPTVAAAPKSASDLPVPNSKGRDWSKFKVDEEEEKLEGDHALNKLFKDIYKDASDDQRQAMMKSFQESGGTVLSTNPSEVLNKKVEIQPPKGMDVKKWEQ